MTSVMESQYNHLKNNILLNKSYYSINESHLSILKHRYEYYINSPRKFSEINTIEELLDILEKRDCVSKNNITTLEDIAKIINNEIFLQELDRIRMISNNRNEASVLSTSPNQTNLNTHSILLKPNYNQFNVKERVYDCIASKMGCTKWLDFARSLNVTENKIDLLKLHYEDDAEKCVKEVLQFHEQHASQREWKTLLLKALEQARRNDLRNEVIKIFDDFS